jgi:hypothetical protein
MSPNCPVCGAVIVGLRDAHSCPGPSGRVSVVDSRDAEIAAIRQQLADAKRFCRKCLTVRPEGEEVHSCFDRLGALEAQLAAVTRERDEAMTQRDEHQKRGEENGRVVYAQLAAAQASEAVMRVALEGIREYWNGAPESAVDAIETVVERACATLATPPSDAVKRVMALERVCAKSEEAARWYLDRAGDPISREELHKDMRKKMCHVLVRVEDLRAIETKENADDK